jgi:hypothetical protein
MQLFVIKDTFTDGSAKETDCLNLDEAVSLFEAAQKCIDAGTLRSCVLLDREGNEIASIS